MSSVSLRPYGRWNRRRTASPITWMRLDRASVTSWALWPAALDRVLRFCTRYDTAMNETQLAQTLSVQFAAGAPQSGVWVAECDSALVGHLVASVESREIGLVGFIWQLEVDVAVPRGTMKGLLAAVEEWAATRGCTCLEMWTAHDPRLWERAYGFGTHRTIMRKELLASAKSGVVESTMNAATNGSAHG